VSVSRKKKVLKESKKEKERKKESKIKTKIVLTFFYLLYTANLLRLYGEAPIYAK